MKTVIISIFVVIVFLAGFFAGKEWTSGKSFEKGYRHGYQRGYLDAKQ